MGRVSTWLGGHRWRVWPGAEGGGRASGSKRRRSRNRMQLITVCLVFLDSCGCGPTPRIHLRVEHPGWRSMASAPSQVKRETIARRTTNPTRQRGECMDRAARPLVPCRAPARSPSGPGEHREKGRKPGLLVERQSSPPNRSGIPLQAYGQLGGFVSPDCKSTSQGSLQRTARCRSMTSSPAEIGCVRQNFLAYSTRWP